MVMLASAACTPPAATPGFTPMAASAPPASSPASPASATPAATPTLVTPPTAIPTQAPATSTPILSTPTPRPLKIGYAGDFSPEAIAAIQRAAEDFGWETELGTGNGSIEGTISDLAQNGAQVIVTLGEPMQAATLSVARKFPDSYFIGMYQSGTDLPAKVLLLDGATAREDQAGFQAGMAAGFVTQVKRVAVIGDPKSAGGLKYRNGFLHGVRYTCPRCRVDNIDVLNHADTADAADKAAKYKLFGVDVFFAAADRAGDAALLKVAQAGAKVIGSGSDVYATLFENGATPGAENVLTSAYIDPAAALYTALTQYHAGAPLLGAQPLSAANGAVRLAPYRDVAIFSPLDQQALATMLMRLADGSFETGIDPLTGEER